VSRLAIVVAVLSVTVAVLVSWQAGAASRTGQVKHAGHVSAQQLAREIRAFEAKGYVPTLCIVGGTLMRNYSTGQSVTVKW
jgi:hypothetical protein